MDGNGNTTPPRVTRTVKCPPLAGDIVKAIKGILNSQDGSTIKRYGKPSKKFVWAGVSERGLSVRLAACALMLHEG
jgi:hypothetical protein